MSGENTRLGHTMTATYRVDEDSPIWLSHFEITRDGNKITILTRKRNGNISGEAEIDAEEFFHAMQQLKDF